MPAISTGDQGPVPQSSPEKQRTSSRRAAGAETVQWRGAETVNGRPKGRARRKELREGERGSSSVPAGAVTPTPRVLWRVTEIKSPSLGAADARKTGRLKPGRRDTAGRQEEFGGGSIGRTGVESTDPAGTTGGESAPRGLARRPRTKAGGATAIRDRFSPSHKLCRRALWRDGALRRLGESTFFGFLGEYASNGEI